MDKDAEEKENKTICVRQDSDLRVKPGYKTKEQGGHLTLAVERMGCVQVCLPVLNKANLS